MARTFLRQDTQIRNSDAYTDSLTAGATLESGAANIQDDLDALRSQIKRALWADVAGNWYDDIPTYNSKKRGIAAVNSDLDDIEEKRLLFRSQVIVAGGVTVPDAASGTGDTIGGTAPTMTLTDAAALFTPDMVGKSITITGATTPANNGTFPIVGYTSSTVISYTNASGVAEAFAGDWSVPGANWVVLSVSGGEAPTETAAVGAVTTEGAVVAQAGTFNAHDLAEVTGQNAITPRNLVLVVDQASGDPVTSNNRRVWGLLQSEVATDGHTFNDSTQQVQISFVRRTATGDDLEACPVADIAGQAIDYSYIRRVAFDGIPETAFLTGAFVDQAGAVDVTRQNAYDNQGTTPVELAANAILDLSSAGVYWEIRDLLNASLFRITEGTTGGTTELRVFADVDELDIDAALVDFAQGATIASSKTRPIAIGVTDGLIESTAGDLEVQAAAELLFDDGNRGGSTFGVPLKLTETAQEWSDLETEYGEVSLAAMLIEAKNPGNARGTKTYANVTSTTTADTDVGGVGGGTNLDAQLPDMSTGSFLTAYDVFLNGELLRPGANSTANNDYYPGTSLANGQLRFEFVVKVNDVLCVVPYNL